jgi:hypothetical protein
LSFQFFPRKRKQVVAPPSIPGRSAPILGVLGVLGGSSFGRAEANQLRRPTAKDAKFAKQD